jgi:hypothetical protein
VRRCLLRGARRRQKRNKSENQNPLHVRSFYHLASSV